MARALGYAQCQRGQSVLFTPLAAMVNHLSAAEATKTLHRALKTYQGPGLLAVDAVGYVSLRQPESHLVFQVLSVHHDRRRPTVIITNRTFGEWNQIFADDAVAHAILDRLAERAEVFHLEGTSYRETHRRHAPKVTPSQPGLRWPASPSTGVLAPQIVRVRALVCPSPRRGQLDAGAVHPVPGESWPDRRWRFLTGEYAREQSGE